MKMRYTSPRPFKLLIRDEIHHLQEGDVIDIEPWKLRTSRLVALFEIVDEDPAKLTKEERKFLKKLRPKEFVGDLFKPKEVIEEVKI